MSPDGKTITISGGALWNAARNPLTIAGRFAVAGAITWIGWQGEGRGHILKTGHETATFVVQCSIIILGALAINYGVLMIRNWKWYDINGAGVEMAAIRRRIGTEDERPNDSIANSIQFASTTVFLATILISFFMVIGKV